MRSQSYMKDHCCVPEGPPQGTNEPFEPKQKRICEVRHQFEALRPR
jgi:hypothetical protein